MNIHIKRMFVNIKNEIKTLWATLHDLSDVHNNLVDKVIELETKIDELEIKVLETEQYSEFLVKKISKLNCQKKRNNTSSEERGI